MKFAARRRVEVRNSIGYLNAGAVAAAAGSWRASAVDATVDPDRQVDHHGLRVEVDEIA